MKMPSVMRGGHQFSMVPQAQIERSVFDRSHAHKTTFDEGYLIPFYVDEALPGDTFTLRTSGFVRLATPLKPLMDNLYLDTFFFAVPYRLVWANFVKMMGEQTDPDDTIVYGVPVFNAYQGAVGDLSDYMGIPPQGAAQLIHSSLWHRAYNLIYNQWFRDENLIDSAVVSTADSNDNISDYVLRKRGKRHDYFTSCLPWPQKGTAVSLPLGTSATVRPITTTSSPAFKKDAAATGGVSPLHAGTGTDVAVNVHGPVTWAGETLLWDDGNVGLYADLANATAATINSIRQAFQIQKMLERDARGGTRYTEIVKSHFGVTSPDARLQRPEYLGGGSCPIMISPIAQNSGTSITGQATPQGNLAGIGTGSFQGHGFAKSFTEHCLLLGICSVRSDLTYQHGLNRMFSRGTRYDFYWPALAHLGEQSVLKKEIWYYYTDGKNDETFGYQERYAEYRYKPSMVSGKFRSTASGTLDIWHLAQKFETRPELNQTFIEEPTGSTAPLYRCLAVPTEPHFIGDFWFDLKCARPMPMFSVPGMVDHF